MTVKCIFCNDTKIEPGIPGPCVWCEQVEQVTLGTVKRYTESCGEGGGVVEHASGQFVEFKDYDAALAREAALREELEKWQGIAGRRTAERTEFINERNEARDERDALQQRLTVAEQRADRLEEALREERRLHHGDETVQETKARLFGHFGDGE